MNRRHFIKLTGTTLSGLFILQNSYAFSSFEKIIDLPFKVFVTLDDDTHAMQSVSKHLWTYKNITVDLKYVGNALRVFVQSPSYALHNVQLQWKYPQQNTEPVLGDHWERTYGDVSFAIPSFQKKLPWYFIQHDDNTAVCFGVKTGCRSICYWQVGNGTLQLTMDTRNAGVGVLLDDRLLHTADIVTARTADDENIFATAYRFCGIMCDHPRLPLQPVYGINDWYFAYGNNSYDLIMQHTSLLADLANDVNNRPFSVIDAGWASYSPVLPGDNSFAGDYSKPNDKFKDMQKLADDIRKLGMRPALWTRPLCAAYDTKQNLLLPLIQGRNDAKYPILDPSVDENIERIKTIIRVYKEWGYDMVKHDYSTYDIFGKWGFEMTNDLTQTGWQFNDRSKTTAEIILNLYQSIRDAAGDMYLIGCNTMSHLAAGLFELNRIGDDTSGKEWARTKKMGVNTLGFRMIQHKNFYAADGDCVGLTNDVPWEKNKQWMQLLALSSTPLFISAQPDAVGAEQKEFIRQCFTNAATTLPVAQPLDWLQNQTPSSWNLNGEVVNFNWD